MCWILSRIYVSWYDGFPEGSYVNICFGLLFRFGLVGLSIDSDLSLSESGYFSVFSWLLSTTLPPTLIWIWFEIYCCLGFLFTSTYSNSESELEYELSLLLFLFATVFSFRFEVLKVEYRLCVSIGKSLHFKSKFRCTVPILFPLFSGFIWPIGNSRWQGTTS